VINLKELRKLIKRHEKINKCIEEGKPIPKYLSKNFVTFPLTLCPDCWGEFGNTQSTCKTCKGTGEIKD
jgi:DnaJ-class molecular chaperone